MRLSPIKLSFDTGLNLIWKITSSKINITSQWSIRRGHYFHASMKQWNEHPSKNSSFPLSIDAHAVNMAHMKCRTQSVTKVRTQICQISETYSTMCVSSRAVMGVYAGIIYRWQVGWLVSVYAHPSIFKVAHNHRSKGICSPIFFSVPRRSGGQKFRLAMQGPRRPYSVTECGIVNTVSQSL